MFSTRFQTFLEKNSGGGAFGEILKSAPPLTG